MSKFLAVSATFALLIAAAPVCNAAGFATPVIKCKDLTEVFLERACDDHGGVLPRAINASPPIDARTPLTPTKTTAIKKTKTQTASTSKANQKVATAKKSNSATAKCIDGAMYFSRERRGACAKHGGVDKWIGW